MHRPCVTLQSLRHHSILQNVHAWQGRTHEPPADEELRAEHLTPVTRNRASSSTATDCVGDVDDVINISQTSLVIRSRQRNVRRMQKSLDELRRQIKSN